MKFIPFLFMLLVLFSCKKQENNSKEETKQDTTQAKSESESKVITSWTDYTDETYAVKVPAEIKKTLEPSAPVAWCGCSGKTRFVHFTNENQDAGIMLYMDILPVSYHEVIKNSKTDNIQVLDSVRTDSSLTYSFTARLTEKHPLSVQKVYVTNGAKSTSKFIFAYFPESEKDKWNVMFDEAVKSFKLLSQEKK